VGSVRAAVTLLGLVLAVVLYVPIAPLGFEPEPDLSFHATTHDAFARHLQMGSDIVSTYGPWGILQRGFDRRTDAAMLAVSALLAMAFAWGAAGIVPHAGAVTVAALLVAMGRHDARFTALAVLLILSTLLPPSPARELPLAAILGVVALIKFPLLVFALFAVTMAAITRRTVAHVLVFGAAFLAAWMAAGQHLGGLPLFVARQIEVAGGYAGASATGSAAIGAAAAAALLLLIVLAERDPLPSIALGGTIIYVAKAGYVRSDIEHAGAASAILLLLAAGYIAIRRRWRVVLVAVAVIAVVAGAPLFADRLLADAAWMRDRPRRVAALEQQLLVLTENGLPPVRESIDSFPAGSAGLIARSLRYTPRPVFWSYMVWTPALGRLNADFLRGPRAPEWLWVTVDSLDGRLPLLDDAPSWLEMLRRYDVATTTRDHLLLRKRVAPRRAPPGAVWCTIEFHPSIARRITDFVFRPAPVTLETTTATGARTTWRISPAMAAGGFLLSPQVGNVDELRLLFAGDDRNRVAQVRVHGGGDATLHMAAVQ